MTTIIAKPSKPRPRFKKKVHTTRRLKELHLVERIKLDGMLQDLLKEQEKNDEQGNGES
jgi:hypothetical protein